MYLGDEEGRSHLTERERGWFVRERSCNKANACRMGLGRLRLEDREAIVWGSCENEWVAGRGERERKIVAKQSRDREVG